MLNTLRRCPASIRWRLVSTAAKSSSRPFLLCSAISPPPFAIIQSLPFSIRASYHSSPKQHNAAAAVAYKAEDDYEVPSSYQSANGAMDGSNPVGPATKFIELAQRGLVDKGIIRTLTQTMRLDTMTEVQSLTIAEAVKGKDVLAQAKTGTGKTIGFLLPVIQRILQDEPSLSSKSRSDRPARYGDRASDIRAIVISPTRELAEQIAEEARKILQNTSMVVQTAVGGTQKEKHLMAMQREGCHLLVGTPGRLKDILSDRRSGVQAPKLSAFVLDEADRLLDQGFMPEIEAIQMLLPTLKERDRQTLMFSATVSDEVVRLVRTLMKPDLHYVRTVQTHEDPTHERVEQKLVMVSGMENLLPAVLELCQREINTPNRTRPFKAIVYFNATAEATFASSVFFNIRRANFNRDSPEQSTQGFLSDTRIFEIHSRLTQYQRTSAANMFRQVESGILMSSDVTARGMDFPGVTHVIQVGLPVTRDVYIHRLGRTARAGQEGEGWLFLPGGTEHELRARLTELPLKIDKSLSCASVDFTNSVAGSEPVNSSPATMQLWNAVTQAASKVDPSELEKVYLALLGTYQWEKNKKWLINTMNRMTEVSWGMDRPPAIGQQLATKLGLVGVPGINLSSGGARAAFGHRDGSEKRPARFGERTDRDVSRPFARGGFGDRGGSPRFSDRGDRGGFGDRSNRSSSFERGDSGSSFQRGDRGSSFQRGDRGSSFEHRDRSSGGGGSFQQRSGGDRNRDRGSFGGRERPTKPNGFGAGREKQSGSGWKRR